MLKWVVRLSIGFVLLCSAGALFLRWLGSNPYRSEPRRDSETNARIIRTAIQQWQAANNQNSCPTIQQLISEKQLDPGSPTVDPWGQPHRLLCTEDEVSVRSAGQDRRFGTADDVVVPRDAR